MTILISDTNNIIEKKKKEKEKKKMIMEMKVKKMKTNKQQTNNKLFIIKDNKNNESDGTNDKVIEMLLHLMTMTKLIFNDNDYLVITLTL